MNKLTLGQQLSLSKLEQLLHQFLVRLHHKDLFTIKTLSHNDDKSGIIIDFVKNCVLYCAIHQLRGTIIGLSTHHSLTLISKIK
jgi:hypothetical protein